MFELPVSPIMGNLQPSMTLSITAMAKTMKAKGIDVVSLCAGEPDFDTPEHIKQACIDALLRGETKYTPESGRLDLRQCIAEKLTTENNLPCTAEQVVVGCGAKFSVFSAIAALCGPGDEVLIPSPYWLSYPEMVKAAGATPVIVKTDKANNFALTKELLLRYITPRTKLLIWTSPSNPTGMVYGKDVLNTIAELALKHNFMILADEIYEKLVYEGNHISIGSLDPKVLEHTITVNGFSKSYSMTGWRMGYVMAPLWLARKIASLQSHTTSNPTSFAQAGAMAAITGTQEPVEIMRQAFKERRDKIYSLLSEIPGIKVNKPQGAFYIFPDISSFGLSSMEFAKRILDEEKVALIPALPFGSDEHVRLSYACSMQVIEEACARLKKFCSKL